jgi:predicted amidophosphoribosyltransferase
LLHLLADPLLDLVYPEVCAICGISPGRVAWSARGDRCDGLRFYDAPHLCAACEATLATGVVHGPAAVPEGTAPPVVGAARTHPDLVRLVGLFKYHGIRGLAWPLARLMASGWPVGRRLHGEVAGLVPVALHHARRRSRGFNQAEILCRLLGKMTGLPVLDRVLVRARRTRQQAKETGREGRRLNLEGAFLGRAAGKPAGRLRRVCLVDDLVTSGWTVGAAADALGRAGWPVGWVLALGVAAGPGKGGRQVDTRDGGF